ncbi:MAG: hypothetical protein AB8H86_07075 [Polyangiales bacterium]
MKCRGYFAGLFPLVLALCCVGCGDDAGVDDGGGDSGSEDAPVDSTLDSGDDAGAVDVGTDGDVNSRDAGGDPDAAGAGDGSVGDSSTDVPEPSEVRVNITLGGDGVGGTNSMVRSGESLGCGGEEEDGPGDCTATLITPATLEAVPPPWSEFAGWVGGPCDGSLELTCELEAGGDLEIEARFQRKANLVFVTEERRDAGFGGVPTADEICANAADAARLPGTFAAFLATGDEDDAFDAIDSDGGWVDTRGNTVAEGIGVLRAGEMKHPIRFSEFRNELTRGMVWTGAGTASAPMMNECEDWTSGERDGGSGTGGNLMSTGHQWRSGTSTLCSSEGHFYCFGTELDRVPPSAPEPMYIGFLSSRYTPAVDYTPDDACADDASDAGLEGTYLALIATEGVSAASKFPMRREIARPDGTLVGSRVYSGGNLASPLNQTADGTYVLDAEFVLTGADLPTTAPADAATTCDDWTDPINRTSLGFVGDVNRWFFSFEQSCQFRSRTRLYCLRSD